MERLWRFLLKCLAVVAATSLRPHRLRRASSTGSKQTASVDPVDVMQKSGELTSLFNVAVCRTCASSLGRVDAGSESGTRFAGSGSPWPDPSLHLLRRRLFCLVRRLPRYYGSVPTSRVRSSSAPVLELPMRPRALVALGEPGISQLPCKMRPYVPGHRPRRTPAKLAITLSGMLPSALCQGVGVLKLGVFRGSITWPVVPPVYARIRPYDRARKTRSRRACSLRRTTLSFATSCGFDADGFAYSTSSGGASTLPTASGLTLRHVIPDWEL